MKKIYSIFISFACFASVASAQSDKEVKPQLSPLTRHYLQQINTAQETQPEGFIYKTGAQGQQYVSAMIKVRDAVATQSKLEQLGAAVGTRAGDIWTVQVPLDKVKQFTEIIGITYIQLDEPVFPNMDQARRTTRVDSVHRGIGLPGIYSGKDVVMGVIDFGFDYNHPSFYDTLGTTFRVKKVWELNGTGTPPAPYNYGHELADTTAIKAATTDNSDETHGTCVAAMASGSGYGSFTNNFWRGMAYDADMVFVGVRRNRIESQWRQGGFSDFADGINYIFRYANNVSKPAVVNISWGSQSGAHDGTSLFNQACDNLSGPGKIIVMSAGNEGQEKIHLSKNFTATDTLINTFLTFTPSNYKRTWVDIWGEPGKTFCGNATLYNNGTQVRSTGFVCLDNNIHTMYLIGSNGVDTCYIEYINSLSELNGKPRMTINVFNKTTDTVNIGVKSTNGQIHMWNEYYYYGYTNGFSSAFSNAGQSWAVSGDTVSTVSDMGAAQSVLLVGAYATKRIWTSINRGNYVNGATVGQIAGFSSHGPMVDGRTKPDISAPGLSVACGVSSFDTAYSETGTRAPSVVSKFVSPINGKTYYYSMFSGTSAASPAAAGIVALMLQVKPTLTPLEAKNIIAQTAIQDTYTGYIPAAGNNTWGYGKINAYEAVKYLVRQTGIYNYAGPKKLDCVLFPNPGNGSFTLDYTGQKNETILVEIYSMMGGLAAKEQWTVNNGHNTRNLDLTTLAQGNYLVKVTGTEGAVTIKTTIK
jgi:minor extracellular serine protease Vpr